MRQISSLLVFLIFSLNFSMGQSPATQDPVVGSSHHRVRSLRVVILSTMLADWVSHSEKAVGEWGFSAIVEADGRRILFDTGFRPDTVLENADHLDIDLSTVTDVFLSHHHRDHTGGLLTLRRELSKANPRALSRAHVGQGMFLERRAPAFVVEGLREDYEASGGVLAVHDRPRELFPGVWTTGPVPRIHSERNWTGSGQIATDEGFSEDTIPEDQSLVINTDKGLVLISGCGHAGIINTMEYAQDQIRQAPMYAAIGGFHLVEATDTHLNWTAEKMRGFGLTHLLGAHCTGINSVFTLRESLKLDRRTAVVGAVGAGFELRAGIQSGTIAR